MDHRAKIRQSAGQNFFLAPLGNIPFPYLLLLPEATHVTLGGLAVEDGDLNTLYFSDPSAIFVSLTDYSQERLFAFMDSCEQVWLSQIIQDSFPVLKSINLITSTESF